ncbi:MAG: hypothetical protein R3F56_02160 [Planctomycetota bacterium]
MPLSLRRLSFSALVFAVAGACSRQNEGQLPSAVPALGGSVSVALVVLPQACGRGQACALRLGSDLDAPLPTWGARVDPCVVRRGGEQAATEPVVRDGGVWVEVPGSDVDAVVALSVPAQHGLPARHAKSVVSVRAADGAVQPTTAVTHRFGLAAELTPLVDPGTLRLGDDLPIKLSVDLGSASAVELRAACQVADGSFERQRLRTGADGLAVLHLSQPGCYAVVAEVQVGTLAGGSEPALTSLSFVVEAGR